MNNNIVENKYLSGEAKRSAVEFDLKNQLRELKEETNRKLNAIHSESVDIDAIEDKYKYLSGEAKRRVVEFDLKKQLRELKEETDRKFNELHSELVDNDAMYIAKLLDESLNGSEKPGVKTRFKKRKVEVSKKALAVGTCIFVIVGGYGTTKAINIAKNVSTKIEQTRVINEEMKEFREDAYLQNTHFKSKVDKETNEFSTIHWHDYTDMIMNTKQANENPIVAFYMIYNSLDDYCRNTQMEQVLGSFNRIYGTNYTNVNDFLLKNGFANKEEWKTYVGNALIEEKETMQNGYSNLGR